MQKNKDKICYNKEKGGYIALLSILVVGTIVLSITISLILSTIDSTNTSLVHIQENKAKSLVSACAEEALQQIRDSAVFTGTDTLSFSDGVCIYTVTNTGGDNRNIQASSTVSAVVRKLEIDLDAITPLINITSWQEVANF